MAGVHLINPTGRKVQVPCERKAVLLRQGFMEIDYTTSVHDVNNQDWLISRDHGGLGDMIAIKASVDQIADQNLTLAFPPEYHYLFPNIKNKIKYGGFQEYGFHEKRRNYRNRKVNADYVKTIKWQYKYYTDLFCPAGNHEMQSNYKPTENRIDNFRKALSNRVDGSKVQIEPKAPSLHNISFNQERIDLIKNKANGKKVICIQTKSANKSKDWPMANNRKLAEKVIKDGHFVMTISFDSPIEIDGVYNITKSPTRYLHDFVKACDAIVTPDSGIMWVGLGLDIPTVALFGPTHGPLTLKYFNDSNYRLHQKFESKKCFRPCYYTEINDYYCKKNPSNTGHGDADCMKEITVNEVYKSTKEFL